MRIGNRDLHSALRTETIASAGQSVLVKLQWGKEDFGYSLHISPNTFSMSGLQLTDLLNFLDFKQTECPFHHGRGYCTWVEEGFNLQGFSEALNPAYTQLREAQRHLETCGLVLPQPEGWVHFGGTGRTGTRRTTYNHVYGDGHTSPKPQRIKEATDDIFSFVFSWIEGGSDKGWVTHYRPKHPPLSAEVLAAFDLLGLRSFANCPEFDFEPCYWHFIQFEPDNYSRNDFAHRSFGAHQANFALGIEKLLFAHAILEPFGFSLLPMSKTALQRVDAQIVQTSKVVTSKETASTNPNKFDIALSFAGTNRAEAEQLANIVREAGFTVFYDQFYPEELWGKDLFVLFDEIYRKRSRYCVMFVSEDYIARDWTNHERRSAQARALQAKGAEYILPIKVDEAELPGMTPTIGYLPLADLGIEKIAQLLLKKLVQ